MAKKSGIRKMKMKKDLKGDDPTSTTYSAPDQKVIPKGAGTVKAAGGGKTRKIGMKKGKKC